MATTYRDQINALLESDPDLTPADLGVRTGCSKSTATRYWKDYFRVEAMRTRTTVIINEPERYLALKMIGNAVQDFNSQRECCPRNCPLVEEEIDGHVIEYTLHTCSEQAAQWLLSDECREFVSNWCSFAYDRMLEWIGLRDR